MQLLKENEEFCKEKKLRLLNWKKKKIEKKVAVITKAYLEVAFDEYGRVCYPQNHIFYNS